MALAEKPSKENRGMPHDQSPVAVLPVVPIYFSSYLFAKKADLFEYLGESLRGTHGLCLFPAVSLEDLSSAIRCQKSGIAICLIHDSGDLAKFVQSLEDTDRLLILSGSVRFIFVYVNAKRLADPLISTASKSAVLQLHEAKNSRVLTEIQAIVEPIRKAMRAALPYFGPVSLKADDEIQKINYHLDVTPPLLPELDDYWIIEEEKHIAKTDNLWSIRATGPGPRSGTWRRVSKASNDSISMIGQTCWQWVFYSHFETVFAARNQKWIFIGNEPSFAADRWTFSGNQPALMLCDSDSVLGWKIQSRALDHLVVAATSEQALSYLPQIMDSIAEKRNVSDLVLPMRTYTSNRDVITIPNESPNKVVHIYTEKQQNSTKFTRVEDPQQIIVNLTEGVKTIGSVHFWDESIQARFKTNITHVDPKVSLFTVRRPISNSLNRQIDALLKENLERSFFFRCLFERSHLFFVGKVKVANDAELSFEIPNKAFDLQRRSSPRLRIPDHWNMTVAVSTATTNDKTYPDTEAEYPIQDLSSTGLAFHIPIDHPGALKSGATVEVVFHVLRRRLAFKAKILYIKGQRVGIKFLEVPTRDTQDLSYFIYQKLLETL